MGLTILHRLSPAITRKAKEGKIPRHLLCGVEVYFSLEQLEKFHLHCDRTKTYSGEVEEIMRRFSMHYLGEPFPSDGDLILAPKLFHYRLIDLTQSKKIVKGSPERLISIIDNKGINSLNILESRIIQIEIPGTAAILYTPISDEVEYALNQRGFERNSLQPNL